MLWLACALAADHVVDAGRLEVIRIDPFDEVIALDTDVVRVEPGSASIRVEGLRAGEGTVLVRRGGMTDVLTVEVRDRALERRQKEATPAGVPVIALGSTTQFRISGDDASWNLQTEGAFWNRAPRNGPSYDGRILLAHNADQAVRVNFARVTLQHDNTRLAIGDHRLDLGRALGSVPVRGLQLVQGLGERVHVEASVGADSSVLGSGGAATGAATLAGGVGYQAQGVQLRAVVGGLVPLGTPSVQPLALGFANLGNDTVRWRASGGWMGRGVAGETELRWNLGRFKLNAGGRYLSRGVYLGRGISLERSTSTSNVGVGLQLGAFSTNAGYVLQTVGPELSHVGLLSGQLRAGRTSFVALGRLIGRDDQPLAHVEALTLNHTAPRQRLRMTVTGAGTRASLDDVSGSFLGELRGRSRDTWFGLFSYGSTSPKEERSTVGGGPQLNRQSARLGVFAQTTLTYASYQGNSAFAWGARGRVAWSPLPRVTLGAGLNLSMRELGWGPQNSLGGNMSIQMRQPLRVQSIGGAVGAGTVTGVVFHDHDGDGVQGVDEPGLPGVRVQLGAGDSVTTDEAGIYRIRASVGGKSHVAVHTTGYVASTSAVVPLELAAFKRYRADFGLRDALTVRVAAYEDIDGNRRWDDGEPAYPIEATAIGGDGEEKQCRKVGSRCTFDLIRRDLYSIVGDPGQLPQGYVFDGGASTADLRAADSVDIDLPVRIERSYGGQIFRDSNENGRVDGADEVAPRAPLEMRIGGRVIQADVDADGRFLFRGLPSGAGELWVWDQARATVEIPRTPYSKLDAELLVPLTKPTRSVEQKSSEEVVAVRTFPRSASLRVGEEVQIRTVATYADFSQSDIDDAELRFDRPGVVEANGSGSLVAIGGGQVSVTSVVGEVVSEPSTLVRVRGVPIVGLTLSRRRVALAIGEVVDFQVHALFVDGSIAEVTEKVDCSSSRPEIVAAERGLVRATGPGRASVRCRMADTATSPLEVEVGMAGVRPVALALTPNELEVGLASAGRLFAEATLPSGSVVEVSGLASWEVADPSVVEVGDGGRLRPVSVGATTVWATYAGLRTTEARVTVVPSVGLLLAPLINAIPVGASVPLRTIEVLEDGTFRELPRPKYQVADPGVVEVVEGSLRAVAPGRTTVEAVFRGQRSMPMAVVVVESGLRGLQLAGEQRSVEVGADDYLDVVAVYDDGQQHNASSVARWQTNRPDIVSVDTDGRVRGINVGRARVWASWLGKRSEAVGVIVEPRVQDEALGVLVAPAQVDLSVAGEQRLAVSVVGVTGDTFEVRQNTTWVVEDPSVAWVEDDVVKAVSVGETRIYARRGDVQSSPVTVRVEPIVGVSSRPAVSRLPVGARVQLEAVGVVADGSVEDLQDDAAVRWSSSDDSVLQVDEQGEILAFRAGRAELRASWRGLETLPMMIDVVDTELVDMQVDPDAASLRSGEALELAVVAVFGDGQVSDATPHVTWTTTRPDVAEVNEGALLGLTPGVAEVFASWMGVQSKPVKVSVTVPDAIGVVVGNVAPVLLPDSRTMLRATALTADGTPLDATDNCIWRVEDPDVARVTADGLLEARGAGTTTLVAEVAGQPSPPFALEVFDGELVRLELEPRALAAAPGEALEVRVMASLDDGRRVEVGSQVIWEMEGEGVFVDRFNRLRIRRGAAGRVRARWLDVRSGWAEIVAID